MGGTNLKIVLSTAESGHFAIAVSREQKRSVIGWSGPLSSPEAATKNAIANCMKRGGTDPWVMVQWADALSGQRAFIDAGFYGFNRGIRGTSLKSATAIFLKCCNSAAIKQRLDMTKTELQVALAAATETNKMTAGVWAGRVETEVEDVIFPDLFIKVQLPTDRREIIEETAKTTSGIWKINRGHIASTPIPFPSLTEQRRLVGESNALRAEIDALKRLQSETAAEIEALLPAILDRAFKREL